MEIQFAMFGPSCYFNWQASDSLNRSWARSSTSAVTRWVTVNVVLVYSGRKRTSLYLANCSSESVHGRPYQHDNNEYYDERVFSFSFFSTLTLSLWSLSYLYASRCLRCGTYSTPMRSHIFIYIRIHSDIPVSKRSFRWINLLYKWCCRRHHSLDHFSFSLTRSRTLPSKISFSFCFSSRSGKYFFFYRFLSSRGPAYTYVQQHSYDFQSARWWNFSFWFFLFFLLLLTFI